MRAEVGSGRGIHGPAVKQNRETLVIARPRGEAVETPLSEGCGVDQRAESVPVAEQFPLLISGEPDGRHGPADV